MSKHAEDQSRYRELTFELDVVSPTLEEIICIEEQVRGKVKERFGDEYEAVDWELKPKVMVCAEKKGEEERRGDIKDEQIL